MSRYRLKIVLLSLGVVLGYASAFAHFTGRAGFAHHACGDWGAKTPAAGPMQPVQ